MSDFRTTLPPFQPNLQLDHQQNVVCFGSCFAEHMAKRLQDIKINCILNPFGIQYNPLNIAHCIDMILNDYNFENRDMVQREGRWFSLWHHSIFSDQDPAIFKEQLQMSAREAKQKIAQTDVFIFTFGTAYYYQHKQTEIAVANCHKLPKDQFEKKRLSPEEIVAPFSNTLQNLLHVNPNAKFIFTVSPIRHAKDGLLENTRSKAILHLGIEALCGQFSQAIYFPSYEIMMDDLRDYRFYTSDMLHPSTTAIDYIWEHFTAHLFSDITRDLIRRIESVQLAIQHRPFHVEDESHQKFIRSTLNKIESLQKEFPALPFDDEQGQLEGQLL